MKLISQLIFFLYLIAASQTAYENYQNGENDFSNLKFDDPNHYKLMEEFDRLEKASFHSEQPHVISLDILKFDNFMKEPIQRGDISN